MKTYLNLCQLRMIGFSIIFLGLVSLMGCVTATSEIEGTTVDISEIAPYLDTLKARYNLTETLKTTKMMVTIQEGDRNAEELREMLWYKKSSDGDDQLRIQVLGAFNDPKGVAIVKDKQFLLALIEEQEAYYGKLSDGVLREIFGIDLRVSDVLSAIFANPFLDGRTDALRITQSGTKYVVKRPSIKTEHTEIITLLVQKDEPRVTEWRITDKEGKILQLAIFDDYREVDGILRPHKVEIQRPLEKTRVVVKMSDVQLHTDIKDSRFDFTPFLNGDLTVIPISESDGTNTNE